jgi:hypothetical protein
MRENEMIGERNKPSDEGRELGEKLAEMADLSVNRWNDELGFVPIRCASCAFNKGTYPNGCLETVAVALQCTFDGEPFMCHQFPGWRDRTGTPETVCAGWILAQSAAIRKL